MSAAWQIVEPGTRGGMPTFRVAIEFASGNLRLRHERADQRRLANARLADEYRRFVAQRVMERSQTLAAGRAAAQHRVARRTKTCRQRLCRDSIEQVVFVEEYQRAQPCRACRAQISIDDEQIRRGQRSEHDDHQTEVGHHGFSLAAQGRAREDAGARQDFEHVDFAMCRVALAPHLIAADAMHLATERSCVMAGARGIAHLQVPAVGSDHLGFKGHVTALLGAVRHGRVQGLDCSLC